MSNAAAPAHAAGSRHRLYEDVMALVLGTMIVAFGLTLYAQASLLTGSTAGLALLLHYRTGLGFGLLFTLINVPFYVLALKRMGWQLTLRTVVAVSLVSLFSRLDADWISFAHVAPLYASLLGGGLMGVGLLMLFRHRTGLGGVNILALYLQDRIGVPAGRLQLAIDGCIMVAACFVLPIERVAVSALGAALLNLIIMVNFRPGRYAGWS